MELVIPIYIHFWSLKVFFLCPLSCSCCSVACHTVAIASIWCPHPCPPPPNPPRCNWTACERGEMSRIISRSRSAGSRQQETELNKPLRTEAVLCSDSCRTETQQSDPSFKATVGEHKPQDEMFSIPSWRSHSWKVRLRISDLEGDADDRSSII